MGSGPFVVSEWSENRRTLTLIRNPNYNGDSPFLDGLTVRFIKESELEIALSEGEGQFDAVGPVQFNIPNPASLTKITYSAPRVIYVAINFAPHNGTPLPPQARQALLLALEREAILSKALAGDGQLMAGSLLPGHWAANGGLSPPAYDPEAARDLLAQAGLVDSDGDGWLDQDGDRLELGIRLNGKNALYRKLGWLASSYYRDLGLFVRAESVPPDSIIDDLFTHDFSLAIFNWPILPDPDQRLYWHSTENTEGVGLNFVSYDNPELDALLDQGVAVPGCQLDARAKIYAQIQEILSQERPVDFLLAPNRHVLVANRLSGLSPGPFAPFTWNAAEWYLQE
jgi:peptide/nickel transport system substrate-binding protein